MSLLSQCPWMFTGAMFNGGFAVLCLADINLKVIQITPVNKVHNVKTEAKKLEYLNC